MSLLDVDSLLLLTNDKYHRQNKYQYLRERGRKRRYIKKRARDRENGIEKTIQSERHTFVSDRWGKFIIPKIRKNNCKA